jgi:hypothetical protein
VIISLNKLRHINKTLMSVCQFYDKRNEHNLHSWPYGRMNYIITILYLKYRILYVRNALSSTLFQRLFEQPVRILILTQFTVSYIVNILISTQNVSV